MPPRSSLPVFHSPVQDVPALLSAAPAPAHCNLVTLRVDTEHAGATRSSLHACLGDLIEIYTVSQEPHLGRSTFQIKTRHCSLDELMSTIMRCLPEAEFGRIQYGSARLVH